ncbi:MAG: sigma-70 family RNA polymerase sigma factor [Bacillota bacterium]|nr:sigma-70 family RNA polymerase sigma factor [Bacillota bacterium]
MVTPAAGMAGPVERHPGEAEAVALVEQARRGDERAREELIRRNLRLVRSVAARFRRAAVEEDDLFQLGCLGLVKAVDRFDPGRGVAFSTYAVPYIAGEILSYLRRDRPLKVGRGTQQRAREVLRAREALAQELGREPAIGEVAARLGLNEEDVVEALDALQAPLSLEAPLVEGEGDEIRRADAVASPAEDHLDRLALAEGLRKLPEVERRLIELRFFGQKTQTAVGRALGLSQVQVCRLEKRALERLRRAMG